MILHSFTPIDPVKLVGHGTVPLNPQSRLLGQSTNELSAWRHINGVEDRQPVFAANFDLDSGQDNPHSAELHELWQWAKDLASDPALLYLHGGHHKKTSSPILQHLLKLLDHRGKVHALRTESRKARRDALVFARGLARCHEFVLVLIDPVQRLSLQSQSAPVRLRYVLLSCDQMLPDEPFVDLSWGVSSHTASANSF